MEPMIIAQIAMNKEIEIRRQVELYAKHLDQLEKSPEKKPRPSLLERLHLLPPREEELLILE